jgi:8-oxo-dGTP pyrophosphatase MutT (NUDIX family)
VWYLRRQAARVVLLDPSDRVLLLEASDPVQPRKGRWWELPGGGMEPGEETGEAAARELYEETGIAGVEMGPCVWRHHAAFEFGGFYFDQNEHVHVARSPEGLATDYRPAGLEALEAMAFQGARWWALEELTELAAGGGRVIPPWLVEQLAQFLVSGRTWPAAPIDMGELGNIA